MSFIAFTLSMYGKEPIVKVSTLDPEPSVTVSLSYISTSLCALSNYYRQSKRIIFFPKALYFIKFVIISKLLLQKI
jgi:hypothetical protein